MAFSNFSHSERFSLESVAVCRRADYHSGDFGVLLLHRASLFASEETIRKGKITETNEGFYLTVATQVKHQSIKSSAAGDVS